MHASDVATPGRLFRAARGAWLGATLGSLGLLSLLVGAEGSPLPGTAPLVGDADRSAEMRAGFRRFLQRDIDTSIAGRAAHWRRDFSSRPAYERSIEPNRARLRRMIGVVDARISFPEGPELIATVHRPARLSATGACTIKAVRWPVLPGVWAEGVLLEPTVGAVARVVALPDADQVPEQLAGLAPDEGITPWAERLAAAGCQVLVPVLISRSDEFSGNPAVVMTNQPHREWVWRQAYEMGRHIIGFEVQKVLAAVDWFARENETTRLPIGVTGYGEGGLLALYSGALDERIDAVGVSGYFDSRQDIAEEPIYRDVLGLLTEFGDAELASLIAPRTLVIEPSAAPEISGPPAVRSGRRLSAAPGRIVTPSLPRVEQELARARSFFAGQTTVAPRVTLIRGEGGNVVPAGSEEARKAFLAGLGVTSLRTDAMSADRTRAEVVVDAAALRARQARQVAQLTDHCQGLMRQSATVREQFWKKAEPKSADTWPAATESYRARLWDDLVGRYAPPSLPPNARTRQIAERATFVVYEVMLDVADELFAWGYLLVPKDLRPDERRPVVVCQHGLEGLPADVVNDDPSSRAFQIYQGFATRLAERGFITYAPHNFYRGGNEFRQLQRLAHPMKKTLFAVTTLQHAQQLRWLSSLAFVDPRRIGFYGLSYGGNTAVRVPALLEQYAAVIASGDFNEWVYKNVTTDHIHSMMYHNVYEVFEYDLGHTFNHAEMAALIAPRPFMVERGHDDGVARDEWVAAEYAKVRRLYAKLGIPQRTEIEFFDGPHRINGVASYAFLHRHLNWPEPRR